MTDAGWGERVDKVLGEALQEEQWHAHVALAWAERYNSQRDGDLDARLAGLDRSLEKTPNLLRVLDLKAELLARAGRYDEARAACAQAKGTSAEIPLRGRAAWISHQQGETERALAEMQAAVDEDLQYFWGWSQLAEWHEEAGNRQKHLEAAERLVAIAPDDSFAWSHRDPGEAQSWAT